MQSADYWRNLFENWPGNLPRKGMVVTDYGESIPFCDFLISDGIVLLEREAPDTMGARKVMLAYGAISAIKITSVIELAQFQAMGFQAPF